MNHIKTKSLVQGAMIAAMFGALSLFNTYTGGIIDIFICYFMVVPVAWYGYQYSIKENIIVTFVSMIVIFMFGVPTFIISSFSACLIGLFLGEMLKREAKKEMILLGTLIICIFNNILIYQVFSGLLGMDIVSEITEMYNEMMSLYSLPISLETLISFIPLIILLMSGLEMYVILLICQLIFMRLKIKFPENFHIATLHFSKKSGLFLGMCLVISGLLKYFQIGDVLVDYIYLLSYIGFVLEGFALGNFYAVVKQNRFIIILLFILFFIPYGTFIYLILGIVDIFSDLRRKLLYNDKM